MSGNDDGYDNALEASAKFNTLQTEEQIQNWLIELCCAVREARAHVDFAQSVVDSNLWYRKLLLRYGSVKGTLDALIRIGKISPNFYEITVARIKNELIIKVTDHANR